MSKKEDNSVEVFNRITEISNDAEWTDEEVDNALREDGIDPEQLVSKVMVNVKQFLKNAVDNKIKPANTSSEPQPLLGALSKSTKLQPTAIADALDVSVTFLSDISRNSKKIPNSWKIELAKRAEERLKVERHFVRESLEHPFQYDRAASRDEPFSKEDVDYQTLLERSGMNSKKKAFWRKLANKETP